MTWARFGYICRKVSVDSKDSETISECLSRVQNEQSCDLYGRKIVTNSWPKTILDRVGNIQDKKEAKKVIEIYKDLNLFKQLEEPMRFKRVIAYLSYVSIVFYIVVAVYQLMVIPSFIETFENFEISIPNHLLFYQNYWGYLVLVVSIFLLSALLIGFQIKKLFSFNMEVENSFIIKYLVFNRIRTSYLRVIDILRFPIICSDKSKNKEMNLVTRHLQAVKDSNMCVSKEMQELIEIEMQSLLESCEDQMKVVSIAVALVVVSAIFFFLVSAYSPIFILGEAV